MNILEREKYFWLMFYKTPIPVVEKLTGKDIIEFQIVFYQQFQTCFEQTLGYDCPLAD